MLITSYTQVVLPARENLGLQYINYPDRELNPRSCETRTPMSFTTVPYTTDHI